MPTAIKNVVAAEREPFCAWYKRVRGKTEDLCLPLEVEDTVVQPTEDVSPPQMALGSYGLVF